MPQADWLPDPLCDGAIYQLGQVLLEARSTGDSWRLLILNEDGQPLPPRNGLLFGFELGLQLEGWYRLYYLTMPALWPSWHWVQNGLVVIEADQMVYLAQSREHWHATVADEDEQFWLLMSEYSWNLEEEG